MISQATIDEVRERASLSEIVGETVTLRRQGSAIVGLCPFHSEKSPSFFIRDDRSYRCFGCGASGNVISFLMETRGMSFPDAVEELARRFGIRIERTGAAPSEEKREDREVLFRVNKLAMSFFRQVLLRGDSVLRSYVNERGLTDDACELFGVGAAPREFHTLRDFLRGRGVSDELSLSAGLIRRGSNGELYDTFRGRLIFPIWHDTRRILAFGGRIIPSLFSEEERSKFPKYVNSSETVLYKKHKTLFGLPQAWNAIRDNGEVYIVEGYMDVIGLAQTGMSNVVATCGTALTEQHVKRLSHIAPRVIVLFDGDSAGKAAAGKCFPLFLNSGLDVSALFLPNEEDPDDVARRLHAETSSYIKSLPRLSLFECYMSTQISMLTEGSASTLGPALKGKLSAEVGELIARVNNPVERALLEEQLTATLALPKNSVSSLVEEKRRDVRPIKIEEPTESLFRPIEDLPPIDREIISCVIAERPLLSEALRDAVLCEGLTSDALRFISSLDEIMKSSESDDSKKSRTRDFLKKCGPSWVETWKKAYQMRDSQSVNIRTLFTDCHVTYQKHKIIREIKLLDDQIRGESLEDSKIQLAKVRQDLSKRLHAM